MRWCRTDGRGVCCLLVALADIPMLASISCVRYTPYLFLFTNRYRGMLCCCSLCSGDDLHSLEGSGSGGDQNRNAIGRTTSRPGARRVLQTFYVPLECFNCVQRPASASASIRECVAVSQKCSIRAGTVYHHVSFSCHCHEGLSFLTLTSSRSRIPVSSCRTSLYRSTARPLQRPRNRMLA